MATQKMPIFWVNDIPEEYAIMSRMLCPECESALNLKIQYAIGRKEGGIRGDRMLLGCTNNKCNKEIEVFFLLPEDYYPPKMGVLSNLDLNRIDKAAATAKERFGQAKTKSQKGLKEVE